MELARRLSSWYVAYFGESVRFGIRSSGIRYCSRSLALLRGEREAEVMSEFQAWCFGRYQQKGAYQQECAV